MTATCGVGFTVSVILPGVLGIFYMMFSTVCVSTAISQGRALMVCSKHTENTIIDFHRLCCGDVIGYRADCNVVSSRPRLYIIHVYCCHLELASQGLSPRDQMDGRAKHIRLRSRFRSHSYPGSVPRPAAALREELPTVTGFMSDQVASKGDNTHRGTFLNHPTAVIRGLRPWGTQDGSGIHGYNTSADEEDAIYNPPDSR